MASYTTPQKLEMSKADLLEVFQQGLGSRYEVYETALIGADLVVKKSAWSGVSVKLVQKPDRTIIRYGAMAPSAAVRVLFMGLIPILILWLTSWKAMTKEIEAFVKSEPRLQGKLPEGAIVDPRQAGTFGAA